MSDVLAKQEPQESEENLDLRPKALAHFGIQTYDVPRLRDWYCTFLSGRVVFEKPPVFCTVSFDDEHHRIAIAGLPGEPRRKFGANPEFMHVAFEMHDLRRLLLNYERLRKIGITPEVCMHHGATMSAYYRDPDGNQCEFFVDCFPTKAETEAWFESPVYQHNFGAGISFDPDALLTQMRAGTPAKELMSYPVDDGMNVNVEDFVNAQRNQLTEEIKRFENEVRGRIK